MNETVAFRFAGAWFVAILAVKTDHPGLVVMIGVASATLLLSALMGLVRKEGQ